MPAPEIEVGLAKGVVAAPPPPRKGFAIRPKGSDEECGRLLRCWKNIISSIKAPVMCSLTRA
jgi:hypothetical protein